MWIEKNFFLMNFRGVAKIKHTTLQVYIVYNTKQNFKNEFCLEGVAFLTSQRCQMRRKLINAGCMPR